MDFTAMDKVMSDVVAHVHAEGVFIAQVFPPEQRVLIDWGRDLIDDLVSCHIAQ